MKNKILLLLLLLSFVYTNGFSQDLQVETLMDLDASGGVTFGAEGNIYVSDFGPALGTASSNTKVYKIEYGSWELSEFASGFSGASGGRFDSQGNFYQSNPPGARVSKVTPDGNVDLNWVTQGISGSPIGITNDADDNLYVCLHGTNTIQKVTPDGVSSVFATSSLFNCPNGIDIDPDGNLYVCNFNDGRVLKITPAGEVSLFKTLPGFGSVGNGHITYSNGFLFVATIGTGQIFKISLSGESEVIAGVSQGFSNEDGPALEATFSKPNGIAASYTGDTLWVNCSVPTWISNNLALHPGKVRMISGVCSLADVDCPLLTKTKEIVDPTQNQYARLLPPTPNPSDLGTQVTYEFYENAKSVRLKLVDATDRILSTLYEGNRSPGIYTLTLDMSTRAAGVYYVILETEEYVLSQKLMIIN